MSQVVTNQTIGVAWSRKLIFIIKFLKNLQSPVSDCLSINKRRIPTLSLYKAAARELYFSCMDQFGL
jgi:hypothetical protein